MTAQYVDVAIVGGGLAGNLLARQLRLMVPHLSVSIFEKSHETSFKVGESTVEIASNYLIRRLGLSNYLYENQLPKNGLRFFFDTPGKDADLPDMSEIGSTSLPFHPSFQLDRARFEADLQKINRENGVLINLDTKVQELSLGRRDSGGGGHRFISIRGSQRQEYDCRWIIDASGRSSSMARHLGLRVSETSHGLGAVWGRFRQVVDIDTTGPDEFRKRVRYTSRMLSTTHFCYPGYWIWFIPLGKGITSVGVVMDHSASWDQELRKREGFLSFLASHQAVWSLLKNAELVDIGSYGQLAYSTQHYFSADRWGLTGEAAVFTDPFYSPGSDFIALENDFLTDLISRDDQGESTEQLGERAELYNQYMRFRYEASMLLYRDLYSLLGSFDLLRLKWQFDFALYYHVWLSQYMQDLHLNEEFLRRQLKEQDFILNALSNFSDLFQKVERQLWARGSYYQSSCGKFANAMEGIAWVEEVGTPQEAHSELNRIHEIFNRTLQHAHDLLEDTTSEAARDPLPLSQFLIRGPLI
jgi:flavin-dependent dehydrogenase